MEPDPFHDDVKRLPVLYDSVGSNYREQDRDDGYDDGPSEQVPLKPIGDIQIPALKVGGKSV